MYMVVDMQQQYVYYLYNVFYRFYVYLYLYLQEYLGYQIKYLGDYFFQEGEYLRGSDYFYISEYL